MLKQYSTLPTNRTNRFHYNQKICHRKVHSSVEQLSRNQIAGCRQGRWDRKCSMSIDQRVQRIKNKYQSAPKGKNSKMNNNMDMNMKQSFIEANSVSMYLCGEQNKQNNYNYLNSSITLNSSILPQKKQQKRQNRKNSNNNYFINKQVELKHSQLGNKIKKKKVQSAKIRQLQQINMKIRHLIQSLKYEQSQQSQYKSGENDERGVYANEQECQEQDQYGHKQDANIQIFQPIEIQTKLPANANKNISNIINNISDVSQMMLKDVQPNDTYYLDTSKLHSAKFSTMQIKRSRINSHNDNDVGCRYSQNCGTGGNNYGSSDMRKIAQNPRNIINRSKQTIRIHANNSCESLDNDRNNHKVHKQSKASKNISNIKLLELQLQQSEESSQQARLIKRFKKQIQLDNKFINCKTIIYKLGKPCRELLQQCLDNIQNQSIVNHSNAHANLTQQQKQIILDFNFQEIDPLFTQRNHRATQKQSQSQQQQKQKQNQKLVRQIINTFIKSKEHWQQKIHKKFNRNKINLSDLDIEQKGYFLKQDLTRFLSVQTKNMYTNRQISIIFRRINKKKGSKIVPIEQFIRNLCC